MSSNNIILITGGTGFVGSHLVDKLLSDGETNIHVTHFGNTTGHVAEILPKTNLHSINLTDAEATSGLFNQVQPTQVYHLASLAGVGTSFDQVNKTLETNTQLQLSVLLAIVNNCPQAKLLTIGTALEYKPSLDPLSETDQLGPNNPYGVSKITQEMLSLWFHQQHHLNIVLTRSFNHFGPRQAPGFVVADFSKQIAHHPKQISVGNLEPIRDMTYVADIVDAYILVMNKGVSGEVYNVGSGKGYTIKHILDEMIKVSDDEIEVIIDKDRYRPVDVPKVIANIDKIKKLGWQPATPLDSALKKTINYYQENL